jgi:type I restriction enzyme S subunit
MLRLKREMEFKKTEVGKIPREWDESRLGEFIDLKSGNYFQFSEFTGFGIRCLKIDNVSFGEISWDTVSFLPEEYLNKFSDLVLKEGDIVIALNRPIINGQLKVGRIRKMDCPSLLYQRVGKIAFRKEGLHHDFLFYVFLCEYFKQQLLSSLAGTDQPYIRTPIFLDIKVPIPPFEEQKRIGSMLLWFDELIENKKRQNEVLEKTAMAIFKSWFMDFEPFKDEEFMPSELGEIPKGWELKRLGELLEFIKGKKCACIMERKEGYLPYLLIETYRTGNITLWTKEKQPFIDEFDVVIVADGESSGEVLRFQRGIVGSTLLALKPKQATSEIRHFLYLFLKSIENELLEHRTGSAIPHLDKDFLANLLSFVPPNQILQKFNALTEPLFKKIILNQKEMLILKELRDLLLPLLVFGKLRVEEI